MKFKFFNVAFMVLIFFVSGFANASLISLTAADGNNYCSVVDSHVSDSCSLFDAENKLTVHARGDIATGELGIYSGNIEQSNVAHAELEETLMFTFDEGVEKATVKFQMQIFGEFRYVSGVNAWAHLSLYNNGVVQDNMVFGDGTGDVLPFINGKILEVETQIYRASTIHSIDLYSSLYCSNSGGFNICDLANTSHLNIIADGASWTASDPTFLTKSTFGNQTRTNIPEPSTLAIFALGMIGLASRRFKKQF